MLIRSGSVPSSAICSALQSSAEGPQHHVDVHSESRRVERALLTGKPSPSLRTLQKYAQAVGKRVQILWV